LPLLHLPFLHRAACPAFSGLTGDYGAAPGFPVGASLPSTADAVHVPINDFKAQRRSG